ncbi:MAG: deoxynucleoside kinase [Candidatus Krumholzibacteriia bacterium]
MPWRYIVVEGVIGVGKTSLVKLLASRTEARVNLEVVEENPFLDRFYQNRAAHAFQTQIFFLLSRFRQQQRLTQPELFQSVIISDYLFAKDRIFANLNLSDDELALYNQLANILEDRILKPDLVVYLQAGTDLLLERIRRRGRSFERGMDRDYIESLNKAYNFFFHHYQETPLLVVGADRLDYVGVPADLDLLIDQLGEPFTGTRYFAPRAGGA